MQENTARVILINPKSKRNRLFLLSLGCLLLCICWILYPFFVVQYRIPVIFIVSVSFMVLLVGLLKYLEPSITYAITPNKISYYHSSGHWDLPWPDVQRIGDITVNIMGEYKHLPYLGIKLKNLENIAHNISPRLANRLLHEQLELLLLAIKNQDIELHNHVINFEPFNLNGVTYKGPVAAWLYRTELLHKAYGYHLFIAESSFDRSLIEFLSLLKACHNYTHYNHN